MVLYFITGNKGKFEEARELLREVKEIRQLDIDLPEIQEIDAKKIITEKIREAFKHMASKKVEFIVEDTSLYLDALNGLPGPLIKWFLKSIGNEGLYKIANCFKNYNAYARTIIGYAKDPKNIYFFEGIVKGKIVEPKGNYGFGWDPIFMPIDYNKTFAEMTQEEKNKISMRKIALEKLKDFLIKEKN